MTFLEAYASHGPDVERVAVSMGIKPHEADRLINREMDRRRADMPRQLRHLDRPRAMVPFVGFDPTEKSWRGK
ncbi:hypothetical protein P9A16_32625 [Shinella sp. 838]|uniref:hypothetical protein n=1 Tax=Shinella sp. 838 TaxID=3038164 RepID=UPI0024157613|nr:hypothetical protein [Shinella sp. 838]MDG4675847.1 hypothetical protein [Shinella sp. 838]